MGVQASGMILPPGSVPRKKLEGQELSVKILGYESWEAIVQYPDGMIRHHQIPDKDMVKLLQKIEGQLRMRYNIQAFAFKAIPKSISTGEIITIGEIQYA